MEINRVSARVSLFLAHLVKESESQLTVAHFGRFGILFPALRNRTFLAQLENVIPLSRAAFLSILASSSEHATEREERRICFRAWVLVYPVFIGG